MLRRRIAVLLFSALVIVAAPDRTAQAAQYCPYPWDAENACYLIGGSSIGCNFWSFCYVCCSAICEVYNYETQDYEYWHADYHWCYECCYE